MSYLLAMTDREEFWALVLSPPIAIAVVVLATWLGYREAMRFNRTEQKAGNVCKEDAT